MEKQIGRLVLIDNRIPSQYDEYEWLIEQLIGDFNNRDWGTIQDTLDDLAFYEVSIKLTEDNEINHAHATP